jgi:hypothetical protein
MGRDDLSPWKCSMSQPIVEAALKPSAAQSYPYLPARMWTTALRLAELVARYHGLPAEAVDRMDRVLSEQDFMFRRARPAEVH